MLPQRLATDATGVKLARYRRGPTHRAARHSYAHAQYIHSLPIVYHCVCGSYRRSLTLAVQCETMHGVNACIWNLPRVLHFSAFIDLCAYAVHGFPFSVHMHSYSQAQQLGIPKRDRHMYMHTYECTYHYSENANRIRLPRINALGNNIRRDRVSNSLFATPTVYIHLSFCFTILVRWTFLPGNSSIWAARAQAKLICKIYVKRADFSTLVSQSDQHTQSTLSITEWWDDQCHMFTISCRSSAAPAFTSSETTSVLSFPTAFISGEFPYCMMEQTCVVRLLSEGTCTCTIKASSSICHIVPYHLTLLNHTYSYIHTQSDQQLVTHVRSHSITEWWDQCHMFTWSCRSSAAPAFTSSETTSILPLLAASISGDSPHCVMTDMCSETLMTGREGSLHTRPSLNVWGREWYRQPSVSYVWVYNLSSGEDRTHWRMQGGSMGSTEPPFCVRAYPRGRK